MQTNRGCINASWDETKSPRLAAVSWRKLEQNAGLQFLEDVRFDGRDVPAAPGGPFGAALPWLPAGCRRALVADVMPIWAGFTRSCRARRGWGWAHIRRELLNPVEESLSAASVSWEHRVGTCDRKK